MSISMWVKDRYLSVSKAFDEFSKLVSEKELYENYPFENDGTLPTGTDDRFNLYFITREENEEYIRRKSKPAIVENVLNEEAGVLRQIEERENRLKTSRRKK